MFIFFFFFFKQKTAYEITTGDWSSDVCSSDLQGIGGAFLFANAGALVTDAFPREQLGLAMGTNTMVAAVGLVIGPVLGGALVAISWHWVFWFNVPLGLAGALWGGLVLHELSSRDPQRGL